MPDPGAASTPRVVVTRPQPQADQWVLALRSAGLQAEALPLLGIGPAPDPAAVAAAWQRLRDYRAVMFVSGHAAEQFFAARPVTGAPRLWGAGAPPTPRAWATGPGTQASLQRCGVAPDWIDAPSAAAAQWDTEALWERVGAPLLAGQKVLIVRGTSQRGADRGTGVGRDWLAQRLRERGLEVDFVVAYQRLVPAPEQRAAALALAAPANLWLFSSSEAVATLQDLAAGHDWTRCRALATHPRIAAAARACGFGVVFESRPSLEAVLASIESLPPSDPD